MQELNHHLCPELNNQVNNYGYRIKIIKVPMQIGPDSFSLVYSCFCFNDDWNKIENVFIIDLCPFCGVRLDNIIASQLSSVEEKSLAVDSDYFSYRKRFIKVGKGVPLSEKEFIEKWKDWNQLNLVLPYEKDEERKTRLSLIYQELKEVLCMEQLLVESLEKIQKNIQNQNGSEFPQ